MGVPSENWQTFHSQRCRGRGLAFEESLSLEALRIIASIRTMAGGRMGAGGAESDERKLNTDSEAA